MLRTVNLLFIVQSFELIWLHTQRSIHKLQTDCMLNSCLNYKSGLSMPKCGKCKSCVEYERSGWKQRCDSRVCVGVQTKAEQQKKRCRSLTPDNVINPALEGWRQSHGPQCCSTARPQNEYWSDGCGIKLAIVASIRCCLSLTASKAEYANRKMLVSIRA